MFALTPRHRYYLYQDSCDMRKGFNGLSGLVRNETDADPLSGDVFVFINRSRTTMKLLVFEGDGYLLYHKRLAAGSFQKYTQNKWINNPPTMLLLSLTTINCTSYSEVLICVISNTENVFLYLNPPPNK